MIQKRLENAEELAKEINGIVRSKRLVVGISGFAGAGKSTISRKLAAILEDALVVHVDDFIMANANGALAGYPHDWEAFEALVLSKVHVGPEVVTKTFDWKGNKRVNELEKVRSCIIIDGPGELFQDAFRGYFDLRVWVDVSQDVANARGMKRDREEYKVDHDDLWKAVWSPKEAQNFTRLRPDLKADFLIMN